MRVQSSAERQLLDVAHISTGAKLAALLGVVAGVLAVALLVSGLIAG